MDPAHYEAEYTVHETSVHSEIMRAKGQSD